MSGDSPNTFTNENVFDFKDGRSSPAPTTSKDTTTGGGVVQASVLVEPPGGNKEKAKEGAEKTEGGEKDEEEREDKPDFCSPIHNNPKKDGADAEKTDKVGGDKGGAGGGGKDGDEKRPLNGEVAGLEGGYGAPPKNFEDEEEDTCLVNCIYYTMECCRCTIM